MKDFSPDKLRSGLDTGFFGSPNTSLDSAYIPELLKNRRDIHESVLTSLKRELETCEEFYFSVAFITSDGLACLIKTFEELEKFNVKGKILTSNYLNFTDPGALSKILQFKNIDLKVYKKGPFHPKGYIFKQSNYYSLIVGSSNLTHNALNVNQEWNLKFLSCLDGQLLFSTREEFDRIWNEAELVTQDWLQSYSALYENIRKTRKFIPVETIDVLEGVENFSNSSDSAEKIIPNKMQNAALLNLNELRANKQERAILIAATGTGKTYLAAFDILQCKPKKVLYVVGRETILKKSEESFKNILGNNIKTGFLTGTEKNFDCDYLFANSFTLKNDEWLYKFKKDEFDYIIIDEVHHSGASTYQKIMDYFKPKFLLGLTATPERTDGFDIFKFFNYKIASEIRLRDALEANLLCPFHYYGVTDLIINGEEIDDKSTFNKLTCDERIKHIKEKILLYSNNSERRKGLIFCSGIKEGVELCKKLNAVGFNCIFLDGSNDDNEREAAINRLENDDDKLEYIITVDIFNEGIDIPAVNQVILLRPTQSAIVYVQQLGRGLRKNENKSYLTVIDFIGNYKNNFMIPIALFGDNSYRKESIRKFLNHGSDGIPGASTIDIEQIAKQKIYTALDNANFKESKFLKEQYYLIKTKIGRIPLMMDFVNNNGIDPMNFIEYSRKITTSSRTKCNSYIEFMCWVEECSSQMNEQQLNVLRFLSCEIAKGIRFYEIAIMEMLLRYGKFSRQSIADSFTKHNVYFNPASFENAIKVFSLKYFKNSSGEIQNNYKSYSGISIFEKQESEYYCSTEFSENLKSEIFKTYLNDIIEYSKINFENNYKKENATSDFTLYASYSRKDVSKLLNWETNHESTMYGYQLNEETCTCPIFVNYKKSEGVQQTATNYDDKFIDNSLFSWMSRHDVDMNQKTIKDMLRLSKNNLKIPLFIQKSKAKNEGSGEHYYIGDCKILSAENTIRIVNGKKTNYVHMMFEINPPVREDVYNYIAENSDDDIMDADLKLA